MNLLNRLEINEEDSVATVIGKSAVIGASSVVTVVATTVLTYAAIAAIVGGASLVYKTIKKIKKNPKDS